MSRAAARPTERSFTVVVCSGCPTGSGQPRSGAVIDAMRDAVRSCPHGMLVTVPCMLGPARCSVRAAGGVIAALQPCTADRVPAGRAYFVGPLDDPADAGRLRDWVSAGRWECQPFENNSA